ncbi:uncharacterized protein LY89DRAFT_687467 [Mollisia scopiformis]|uniref:Glycosyltransferase family 25 protein n=1 Tax=Mollisia scopiformis TaxID=149040 RepID=A0A194WZC9_MOLSC|nr:uncharacterized protein LY89DRAFT_687467 [Mollisia scopiformis]KUJ13305.1 hypothetical protein LY89DRAFT_687467 [Mollisia scopiformis]
MPPPIFKPRRRLTQNRLKYGIGLTIFIILTYLYLFPSSPVLRILSRPQTPSPHHTTASNSTLGFQKILVLSTRPSWRTRGLHAAAAHTNLDLTIPNQALPTDELITAFQSLGPSSVKHPLRGEAFNWLAHLDLMKLIAAQDYTTALILEDDVDWDVSIKEQMKLLSDAVREFTYAAPEEEGPYGERWDVLWLGHCGEPTRRDTRRLEYFDASVPAMGNYSGWAARYHDGLSEGVRVVQRAVNPVCSFAFAVTRRGARKILKWAGKGENEAYDIRLMQGCKEKRLSCVVVNPELMHHYVPPREFGHISNVAEGNGRASEAEEEEFERIMGNTANVVNSTRCRALFDSTCMR